MGNDCGYKNMGDFDSEDIILEKFYVYRSLHTDNSWGVVVFGSDVCRLPNVSFGMKVFARNEIEAIGKAKEAYDKIHGLDIQKENMRKFASAALRALISSVNDELNSIDGISELALQYAAKMNEKYIDYFSKLEDKREVKPSPLSKEEMEPVDEEVPSDNEGSSG